MIKAQQPTPAAANAQAWAFLPYFDEVLGQVGQHDVVIVSAMMITWYWQTSYTKLTKCLAR
jgi:hypothetical protein